ncbi:MAG: transmembrane protein 18-domain-containing protein [Monoraphidium minutum]|nr:MAG: transmembrane protein 18-domain-containing protein [Monoraphidium minutum]
MADEKPLMEQLTEAHDEVVAAILKPIREAWREMQQEAPLEALQAFLHAVDWREPWLAALLAGQALLFLSVVALRRSTAYLSCVFCFGAAVVYFGERLNGLAAAHWRAFAAQPYFDPSGAFFSAVVSGPLFLTLFTALVMYLLQVAAMMAEVKRAQLRHQAAQRQRAGAGGSGGAAAAGTPDTKKGR